MPKAIKKPQNSRGFTIIELLVVILVIGALSGVLLGVVNSSGVRAKARDSQRKADLKRIQTALELYFAENRQYPATAGPNNWERITAGAVINTALEPDYIDPVPNDPTPAGNNSGPCSGPTNYRYNYRSNGNTYNLTAIMEVPTSNDDSPCGAQVSCAAGYANEDVCYFARNP